MKNNFKPSLSQTFFSTAMQLHRVAAPARAAAIPPPVACPSRQRESSYRVQARLNGSNAAAESERRRHSSIVGVAAASVAETSASSYPSPSSPSSSLVTADDRTHMHRALELARRGLGSTEPNPAVGCVIVSGASGEEEESELAVVVVGEGFHPRAGRPHAEVYALRAAGQKARGGTAYVTLEPCAHHGRTPPCARALIDAGVKRVSSKNILISRPRPSSHITSTNTDSLSFSLKNANLSHPIGRTRRRGPQPFS